MNILGPKQAYTDILDYAIVNEKREDVKRFPLRPSSSGECTRALAYQMQEYLGKADYGVPQKDARTQMLLDLGNSVEYHLNKWFKKCSPWFTGKYMQQVVEFYEIHATKFPEMKYLIEGSTDRCFYSEVHKCVVDYKSKGDRFDKAFKTAWDGMDEKLSHLAYKFSPTGYYVDDLPAFLKELKDPYFEANFLQVNGYLNCEFFVKRGFDHGAVIQSNKNDSRKREIRFRPSRELFLQVKDKFQKALDAAAEDNLELAPKDYALGSMKCSFCPYAKQCWPSKDPLKAFFKTLPPKNWPDDIQEESIIKLFEFKEELEDALLNLQGTEDEILKWLEVNKLGKIRLPNGHIYEVKHLKSPKPHYELRRSKL